MDTHGSHDDKRQFPRVTFDGQAQIRIPGQTAFIPCEPRNVSLGGACLRMATDVELRCEVDVQLASDATHTIECHGRVNWTTARLDLRSQPPIPYDIGIEFVGLSLQLRAELQRVIETRRASAAAA